MTTKYPVDLDEARRISERMIELDAEADRLARFEKLTASQERRSAEIREEFQMLDERAQAIKHRNELNKVLEAASGSGEYMIERGSTPDAPSPLQRRRRTGGDDQRGRALDQLDRIERSSDLSRAVLDVAAEAVEKDESSMDAMARWVLAAGDDHYRAAFGKLLRNPTMGQFEWTDDERAAFGRAQEFQRSMSLTDSAGGYMVPFTLDPAIMISNAGTSNSNLRKAFTVKRIATDAWHGVSSAGVTGEWTAEATEVADASPTLTQPKISVHKGDAFVPFSFEAQDDILGLEAELMPLLVDAKDRLEAKSFITGTGTGQPKGLITSTAAAGGSVIVAPSTAETYAAADVYKLKAALPARHRASASWLANETVYDLTRQFASGAGPTSAFWADFGDGTPSRLLGKPVFESSEMDDSWNPAVAANNYLLVYGDLRQYYVVDRVGTTVELVPHLMGANQRPTGQRGLLMWFRTGGDLVNPDAVRVLNVATTV